VFRAAGAAVGLWMIAEERGDDPADAVEYIEIENVRRGGATPARAWWMQLTRYQEQMCFLAGAIAEAKVLGKSYKEVTHIEYPDVDVEEVVEKISAKFGEPAAWHALGVLAERLPFGVGERMGGRQAWDIYSAALAAVLHDPDKVEFELQPVWTHAYGAARRSSQFVFGFGVSQRGSLRNS
jgi:hypothetical protein